MKTVWILNHYAQVPGRPGGTRHYALAKGLKQLGWHGIIIAASTEHNTSRQRLADGIRSRMDTIDGVSFLWLRCSSYSGNGFGRIRNIIEYTWRCLFDRAMRTLPRPDVIIGSTVHPLAAWAGSRLARRYDVPFVFEVRDLWPQTLIDMGRLRPGHPLAFGMARLEEHLLKRAAKVVSLLPHADVYFREKGVGDDKFVWIPNGADLEDIPYVPPAGKKGEFVLMYFGAHGAANGLDTVLDAMGIVMNAPQGKGIKLRLIGDGPRKDALRKKAGEIGLTNISFEPPVPKSKIHSLAAGADGFVFCLADVAVFKYGISPNKLFDFLAAGRPIVFAADAANNPVADAGAGLTVPPEQPTVLAQAMLDLAALPLAERERMGRAGRQHVEAFYSTEVLARRMAATLDEACAST